MQKSKISKAKQKELRDLVYQGRLAEVCKELEAFARRGNANAQFELGRIILA